MIVKPHGDRVAVKLESTETLVLLPDGARLPDQKAIVVAIGNGRISDQGKLIPVRLEVGDRVMFGQYTEATLRNDGEEFHLMHESNIIAVLEDNAD